MCVLWFGKCCRTVDRRCCLCCRDDSVSFDTGRWIFCICLLCFSPFYVTRSRRRRRLNVSQKAEGKQDKLLEEAFHLFIYLSCGGGCCWLKGAFIDEIRPEIGGETDRLQREMGRLMGLGSICEYSDRDVGEAVTAAVSSFSSSCETQKAHVSAVHQRPGQVVELMHYLKPASSPSSLHPSLSLTLTHSRHGSPSPSLWSHKRPKVTGTMWTRRFSTPPVTAPTLPHRHTHTHTNQCMHITPSH